MVGFWRRNRLEVNFSAEFVHYPFLYDKAKPDSVLVVLLGALDEAKQLEELILILPRDSHSCVCH